ncbi:NADP-dependent oxidoreductase domain-containing protein [Phlebopus sp. FC_14]|nr:NADP-dependent oxidoreductase domain-containing protein [Phlebopus sp. FC_14]
MPAITATSIPSVKLNTGVSIPMLGLGCFSGDGANQEKKDRVKDWTLTALKAGYRHLDTAWMYGTEHSVGAAIRESGIPREEIFVTTKLPWHHPGYVAESIDESLRESGLDYFDLYLMHFPQATEYPGQGRGRPAVPDDPYAIQALEQPTFNETWADMEKVLESGKVKAIGVSNFSIKTLEKLLKTAKIVPAVNQVELHPYLAQPELLSYCKSKGIVVSAYAPTGYAKVRTDPTLTALASKQGVTTTQLVLAWHVARGCLATPKSEDEGRQKENLELPHIDDATVAAIDALDRNERLCNYPNERGMVYGWTMEQFGW